MDSKKRKRRGERPDGLIQVSVQLGRKADGKPNRKYFYGHTRGEAESKRDAYMNEIRGGNESKATALTVATWVKTYLETYRTGVNELYYGSDDVPYNRLVDALGERLLASITESDLQRALNKVAGMSFSTVEKYRQAISRVFRKAYKNRLIPYDPADELTLPTFTK